MKIFWLSLILVVPFVGYGQDNESVIRGEEIYKSDCQHCHMANGEGMSGVFPPVANVDYFKGDLSKAVQAITKGVFGEITVNGKKYYGSMTSIPLNDEEIADVVNYMLKLSGRESEFIGEGDVADLKK